MQYAKIDDNGTLAYAPKMLKTAKGLLINPSAVQYAEEGWLPLDAGRSPGKAPAGSHWRLDGWEISDGAIVPKYALEEDAPPPPRTFSKLKVVAALTQSGVWPQVKAWIEEAGLYDLYLAAQDFAEDNEWFAQGLAALKPALGWTDEQVEALLAKCVKEEA